MQAQIVQYAIEHGLWQSLVCSLRAQYFCHRVKDQAFMRRMDLHSSLAMAPRDCGEGVRCRVQRASQDVMLRGRSVVHRRPAPAVHQALPGRRWEAEEVRGGARPVPPRLPRVHALQQRHQKRPHHLVPPGGGRRVQGRLAGRVARPRVRARVEQQLWRARAASGYSFAGFTGRQCKTGSGCRGCQALRAAAAARRPFGAWPHMR